MGYTLSTSPARPLPPGICDRPSVAQLAAIWRLRYSVYVKEMGKPYPHASHATQELKDATDAQSVHLFIEHDGEIAGAVKVTVFPGWLRDVSREALDAAPRFRDAGPGTCLVGRLVIGPHCRRTRRYTLGLMRAVYCTTLNLGQHHGFCFAAGPVVPVLKRVGWRSCGRPFAHPDSGATQTPLVFDLTDTKYLERIRSPLLDAHGAHPEDR